MKKNLQIILAASTASFLTSTVMAQLNADPTTDRTGESRDRGNQPQTGRLHSAAKASDIIGMKVNNNQDEELASVEDLAVDLESGRIVQVILATGGFAGVGARLTAVPPGALQHDLENKVLQLDANKEKLTSAPEFKTAKGTESSDTENLSAVYRHFGQESDLTFIQKGDAADDASKSTTPRKADGTWEKDRLSGGSKGMIPASRLGQSLKATKLMSMDVKNLQDESIGKVDELLLDLQSGRIVAVIVSSGGFLGMGDTLSAVPPTAFSVNSERDTLQLDVSKDKLGAAPHFKSNQWPDFNEPAYSDSVYRAYNEESYFGDSKFKEADNTARNVRDRGDRTLTPMDQGNSKVDTETTAQIRKAIMDGKELSMEAKNVKIITNNGRVTLRGPVKSEAEKRQIGDIANRIASSANVDNQLEVKIKHTSN